MKASSESGLWATWMVFGIRLLLKLLDHRLVLEVFNPLRAHLLIVVRQETGAGSGEGGGVLLDLSRGAPNEVAEKVPRDGRENGIGQRLSTGEVSRLEPQDRRMVSRV